MRLGIWDVRPWLESLAPGALDAWWAYYQLEPWDMPRECWPDMDRFRGPGKGKHQPAMISAGQSLVQMREIFGAG